MSSKKKETVLIFGISGMVGHKLFQILGRDFFTYGTVRGSSFPFPLDGEVIKGVDIRSLDTVQQLLDSISPEIIINCVGIIPRAPEILDDRTVFQVNSVFPHLLAGLSKRIDFYLIHLSSDCVFSGNRGNYSENDIPDPENIYGESKLAGEVTFGNSLTLRTSLIGHELEKKRNLLEWFLGSQDAMVKGYSKAIFNGITTITLAEVIKIAIWERLTGIFHLGGESISKYKFLTIVKEVYNKKIEIIPYPEMRYNRSLNSKYFSSKTGFDFPSWESMIKQMFEDYLNGNVYSKR